MTTYEAWAFLQERYKNREFKSRPHYADYIPKAITVLGEALGIDSCPLYADDTSSEKITPHDAWMFFRRPMLHQCVRSYAGSYNDGRPMRVSTHVLELHEVMTVIDAALDYTPHYMDQLPEDFTPKAARGMYVMRGRRFRWNGVPCPVCGGTDTGNSPVFYKGDSICIYQACHDCQRVVDVFRWRQVIADDAYKVNKNL